MTLQTDDFDDLLTSTHTKLPTSAAPSEDTPLAVARRYIAAGWSPVPVPYRKKGPTLTEWGRLRLNHDTAAQHFSGRPQNVGVILGTASDGLVDIDLDSPQAVALATAFLPPTEAIFGRAGNPKSHWLYRAPDMVTEQIKRPGTRETLLELRSNSQTDQPCQTVFPGSVHVEGEPVTWHRSGAPAEIDPSELQSKFRQLAAATILTIAFPAKGRHDATLALIGLLTRAGWDQNRIVDFVRSVRCAAGADPKKALRKMAEDASERLTADKSLYGLPTLKEAFGEKEADRFCELVGYDASLETHPDEFDDAEELQSKSADHSFDDEAENPVTRRLNRRHAVVVTGGRTVITTEGRDGSIAFGTVRDIHAFYENDQVTVAKGKTEAASKRWMRDPERRTFRDGVTFAPGGCSPTMLNLWRGWAVEPDPAASCERFLNHLRHVVCNGDAEQSTYLLGWLAHMVQRPDEKPGVALVLRGAKGAGKDTVADYVSRMIGRRHAPTVAESSHIVGKFNARLENALLLHVQEGSWAGDRRAEGVLKYLVTSDRIEIERKGIDSINLPSVLRMFISANADWVVPASADERRWAVFEVSDRRRGNEAYFTALRTEMNGNGPAALLHYLQNYDLSGFNVRKAPETEGLRNQKIASLRNIDLWWFEMLNRGVLSDFEDGDGWSAAVQLVGCREMRRRYLEWMKGRRFDGEALEERHFGRRMSDMLPEITTRRPSAKPGVTRIRQYEVPTLADCRAAFDRWLGQPVDWETEEG